jgi:hypothetical protein
MTGMAALADSINAGCKTGVETRPWGVRMCPSNHYLFNYHLITVGDVISSLDRTQILQAFSGGI